MKSETNYDIKEMKNRMKAIIEILKGVKEDDTLLATTRSTYSYKNAMNRNRNRFYDLIREINEMAETAARLYNHYNCIDEDCNGWMIAQANYELKFPKQ